MEVTDAHGFFAASQNKMDFYFTTSAPLQCIKN